MTNASLNQIMNDMASGAMDANLSVIASCHSEASQNLSELDAFIRLDDHLSGLNKEYLDAKNHYEYLAKTFGCDDAMTEVAEDMMDSAWCALQTRYLEVRANQTMMQRAQQMMLRIEKQEIEIAEKKEQKEKIERSEKFIMLARMMEKKRERHDINYADLWAIILILFNGLRFGQPYFQFKSYFNMNQATA